MAGVRAEYKNLIIKNRENTRKNGIKLFFYLVIIGVMTIGIGQHIKTPNSIDLSGFAMIFSFISILSGMAFSEFNLFDQYTTNLFEDSLRQKQEELKHIGDSIELFYLPLHDLLTTYDENITNKAKSRRITQINGHKHLAEPRVRGVFEKYASNEANSRKLLELVNRDIELLQNRFIELKVELKDE